VKAPVTISPEPRRWSRSAPCREPAFCGSPTSHMYSLFTAPFRVLPSRPPTLSGWLRAGRCLRRSQYAPRCHLAATCLLRALVRGRTTLSLALCTDHVLTAMCHSISGDVVEVVAYHLPIRLPLTFDLNTMSLARPGCCRCRAGLCGPNYLSKTSVDHVTVQGRAFQMGQRVGTWM